MTGNPSNNGDSVSQGPPPHEQLPPEEQQTAQLQVLALDVPSSDDHHQMQNAHDMGGFRAQQQQQLHNLEEEVVGGNAYEEEGNIEALEGSKARARYARHASRYANRHHPYAPENVHFDTLSAVDQHEYNDIESATYPRPDEYVPRQYSPQGRSEWPVAQHLPQVAQWIDGRTVTSWSTTAGPVGVVTPIDHNGRYVMNQKSWLDQQRPSSAMSSGVGTNSGCHSNSRKLAPSSPDAVIPDCELSELTVKELNKRVQNLTREDIVALKQRRRTLKNRGYAMNCRIRRQQQKETLEMQVERLMEELKREKRDKSYYKEHYDRCPCSPNAILSSSAASGGGHNLTTSRSQQLDLSIPDEYKRGSGGGYIMHPHPPPSHHNNNNNNHNHHPEAAKHLMSSDLYKTDQDLTPLNFATSAAASSTTETTTSCPKSIRI